MKVTSFRTRAAGAALVCCLAPFAAPDPAHAAAQVNRFALTLAGVPTQVNATNFNENIDFYNRTVVTPPPRGYDPVAKVTFAWLFDSELRYFATRSLVVDAGVGQLRTKSTKEYLPGLAQSINVRAELITVPIHIGAAYYLQPYNQGDFQARLFVGAGLVTYSHSRALFTQDLAGTDSATTAQLGGSFHTAATQDAPGYYAEAGAHMFFATRYSVLLSLLYRSGEITDLRDERTGLPVISPATGKPASLDVGGVGFRMAVAIGL